jgi:hypothetical protein
MSSSGANESAIDDCERRSESVRLTPPRPGMQPERQLRLPAAQGIASSRPASSPPSLAPPPPWPWPGVRSPPPTSRPPSPPPPPTGPVRQEHEQHCQHVHQRRHLTGPRSLKHLTRLRPARAAPEPRSSRSRRPCMSPAGAEVVVVEAPMLTWTATAQVWALGPARPLPPRPWSFAARAARVFRFGLTPSVGFRPNLHTQESAGYTSMASWQRVPTNAAGLRLYNSLLPSTTEQELNLTTGTCIDWMTQLD